MNWERVKQDTYYQGRKLESEARTSNDPAQWKAYADLKTRKGSYTLGIHGYLNAATLFEARGDMKNALAVYADGVAAAMRTGNRDFAVILTYRMAQIHENARNWDAAILVYEDLGRFCEEKGEHFLAADAYEHAAEMMVLAGRSTADYTKPISAWEDNIRHWEAHDHDHDAVWSRNHIDLYKKLFGVKK